VDSGARALLGAVATGFAPLPGTAGPGRTDDGPLNWPGYAHDRARSQARSGEAESVLCGIGRIGGHEVVLIAFEFGYIGGSIGEDAGARIVAALTEARRRQVPAVSLIATGGSRMQEGVRSLRQLQLIAAECAANRAAGIPHIAVLRDPTTGGVWASLGAGADIHIGVRGATLAFAGGRVRGDASGAGTGDDFLAEGKYRAGQLDELVDFDELPAVLARLVDLLANRPGADPAPVPYALGRTDLPPDGWTAVRWARDPARPRAGAYLDDYFQTRVPIRGDRAGGVDRGLLCGIGRHAGRTIAFAAQNGTATTAAGFRTATRLIQLADRLRLPVLTIVDTPGAANDAAAERDGIGPAIAGVFAAIAQARVPVTTLVVGEGGSGGALALASPQRLWICADAYFSVIDVPAAARILKRDAGDVPVLADQLRIRPQDLLADGLVTGIAERRPGNA
jgi:acyl-CoA carboxylase subunit beta